MCGKQDTIPIGKPPTEEIAVASAARAHGSLDRAVRIHELIPVEGIAVR